MLGYTQEREKAERQTTMGDSGPSPLNKLILNNFLVKNRPLARQGKDHVIKKLIRNAKKLREKKTDNDKQKEKFHRKADRLLGEVKVLKHMHPDEVMKFALLNKKSYAVVGNNPKAKIEERALCRLTEHKGISATIGKLREQYINWAEEIPVFIKGLGIRHRDKKLKKLKRLGKLESFLEKEHQYLKLLQELTDIDIDPKILKDATSATNKIEKKQTSSRSRKRKREKNMDAESLKAVKKRKEKKEVDKVIDKGNGLRVGESKKEVDNSKDDFTQETGNECAAGKMMEQEIRAESAMSEEDSPESDNIDTESDDSSADDGESEHENNEASTINGENGSDNEDGNGSDNECDNEPSDLVNMVGQDLQNHRIQVDNDSDSSDESDSEDNNESGNSDSESSSDRNYKVPMRKKIFNSKCHIGSKIQKASGTAEVKQLDLRDINGTIQGNEDHKVMYSEDEDFFLGKTEPKKVKKSRKRSDFFLGLGKDNEESEDTEETDDQESDNRESAIKNSHSDAEDSDDNGVIDTSKYFKRNLFRSSDDKKRGEWGRGGNRGRGGDRGQGRDRGRGRDRGQRWNRGHRGNRGQRGDRGYRGHRGRGDGRRGDGKGEGDENGEKLFRSGNDNKDLGYQRNDRIGIGRGYKKDENREYRRGESRGTRRGSQGIKRGGNQVDEHRGGYTRNQFSRNSNVGHQDQRGGSRSRKRGMESRFSKQLCWQSDAGNPNMIPLPERKNVHIPTVKGEAASGGHLQSLHPSWQAKLREKEKSASINQFKGKRMLFDQDN